MSQFPCAPYVADLAAHTTVPLGIQILPAIVLATLILSFPESPRWLIDHGRPEEGLHTLARLHANGNVEDPWVKAEFAQIEEAITYDHEHEAKSYTELFTNRYVTSYHPPPFISKSTNKTNMKPPPLP